MTEFIQLFVLGMATGGFYTVNALGTIVVFRGSGIINFASGGVAMVGGYLEWDLADQARWPAGLAVAAAIVACALLGLLIYLLAIRPLSEAATLTKVIATLAVLVSIQQGVLLICGGLPKVPTSFLPVGSVHFGAVVIGTSSLILLLFACALTLVLWVAYRWTRFGQATSALAEAPRSLAALGWDTGRLRAVNWLIGGALAGLAGAMLGPILELTPGVFTDLLIPTLACALIGGFRSFPLTLVGGLLLGGAQALAARYVSVSGFSSAVPFLLIITVLVVRGRALPLRSFVQERLPRVSTGEINRRQVAAVALVAIVLGCVASNNWVIGATTTVMIATVLLSQVVITGFAGQLSLAQLTLAGAGGVIAANIAAGSHTPFLVSLLVGMVAVIPLSILVGLPSLRARGAALAIATLGLAASINAVVLNSATFTGGLGGLTLPTQTLFGWSIDATVHPRRYFFVAVVVFALLATAVINLRRGRSGRRLLAVRNNERAASAIGINVVGAKLYAFTLAGVIAAAGGVLLTFNEIFPQFTGFDPLTGLTDLLAAVLGGIGFVSGSAIGGMFNSDGLPNAILNPVVGNLTWWTELFPLAIGVGLVLQLIKNPDGIAAGPAALKRRRSARGGSRRAGRRARQADRRTQAQQARRDELEQTITAATMSVAPASGSSLRLRDIRVVFGTTVVLDGVDLDVDPGEVLAVIGPNGAGKTTLLDAVTGFVPCAGTIVLDGRRIDRLSAYRRARAGVVRSFQSLELFEDMTVMDNVRCAADPQDHWSLVADLFRPDRGTVTAATAAAIDALGLRPVLDRLPPEIGYGDRRLVGVARALASAPGVLLLDEPAAGLSEFERGELVQTIGDLARKWNLAVLLIEHDVDLVRQVADRVVMLDFGKVISSGTPAFVLAQPEVIHAYLGTAGPPAGTSTEPDSTQGDGHSHSLHTTTKTTGDQPPGSRADTRLTIDGHKEKA